MNTLKETACKLAPKQMSISNCTRKALMGVVGFSAIMIAKSELDKQSVKKLINLKKERLQMVSHKSCQFVHLILACV